MVHCKQARRKPRGAPKNGERAPGGASAPLPGYLRATTSSSGARAGRVSASSASSPATAAPPEREAASGAREVFHPRTPRAGRATCSSALRSAHGGGGCEGRACRYAYCSLKGHALAPPLGAFVAAARTRLIKTEQRMKHRGVSAFRDTKIDSNAGLDGFFVKVYPGAKTVVSSGSSCSGLSTEESRYVTFDRRSGMGSDPDGSVDGSCGSSDVISDGFADLVGTARSPGLKGRIHGDGDGDTWGHQDQDQEAEDSGACRSDISEELGARYEGKYHGSGDASLESSMDDISSAFVGMNFQDAGSDPTDAAASQRNKVTMSRRRTAHKDDEEQIRAFNPRAPNFLPVEPDPDDEKVDLRHQTADDRKNAEEWMVDYALRRTVKSLARAQKRKVEMLVQAFESVVLPIPGENSAQQDGDKKNLGQARTWQPCN